MAHRKRKLSSRAAPSSVGDRPALTSVNRIRKPVRTGVETLTLSSTPPPLDGAGISQGDLLVTCDTRQQCSAPEVQALAGLGAQVFGCR